MNPPIKPVPDDEWEGVVAPSAGAQEDEWEGIAPGAALTQDQWEGSNDPRSMRVASESTGTRMQVPVEGPATAKSIVQGEQINRAQNEAAIDELLKRPNLAPAQRERLERLKTKFHDPFWYNQKNTERTVLDNLARGFAVGVVNNNILALADLALAAPDWLGIRLAEQLRDRIEEAQFSTKLIADPQGKEATVGNVIGTLIPIAAGKANPWAVANERGFKALQVLARKSPGAARALANISKGFDAGATYNQRLVAQLVGSGAVDALQVADIFMNPRYGDDTSRMKALLLTVGAATAGAGFAAIRPNKIPTADVAPSVGKADPARKAQVDQMAKQEADVIATKAAEKEFKAKVRSSWEAANPGKSWQKDLSPSGRNKEMTQARVKQQPGFIKSAPTEKLKKIATQLEKSILEASDEAAATDARQTLKVVQDEIASRSTDSNVNPSTATNQPPPPEPSTSSPPSPAAQATEATPPAGSRAEGAPTVEPSVLRSEIGTRSDVSDQSKGKMYTGLPEITLDTWLRKGDESGYTKQDAIEAARKLRNSPEGTESRKYIVRWLERVAKHTPKGEKGDAILSRLKEIMFVDGIDAQEVKIAGLLGMEPTREELEIAVEHLARNVDERNAALRAAEIDPGTGFGNSLAWDKAKPAIDADPDIDVVYVDVKNLHAANAVRTHEGMNKYFEEIGDAVRKAEKEVGSVKDGSRAFRVGGDEFAIAVPAAKSEAFKKALAKALPDQPIYNKGGWKKYVTGVTIASGKTTADADRALTVQKVKTLKPSEDDVRAMTEDRAKPIKTKKAPRTDVKQVIPGVKLTKPLSEHTAKDIDKTNGLLDRLDKALEEQKITPAQYGTALEMIGEHRRTLPAAKEQFTVEQIATAKADAAKKRLIPEEDPPIPSGPTVSMAVVNVKNANGQINQYRALNVADAERQAIKAGDLPADYHTLNTPQREKLAEITYESVPVAKIAPVEGVNTVKVKSKPIATEPSGTDIRKTPVTQLSDELLEKVIDKLRVDNASIHSRERAGHPMIKRFEDAVAELARRRNGGSSNGSGVVVHTNPAVTGFVAGFAGGFMIPADSDQQRLENALYAGAAVAAGTWYVNKRFQQAKTDGTPSFQRTIRSKVKSIEDQPFTERIGLSNYLHNAWMGIARRSFPAEKLTEAIGRTSATFMHNLGRQAELFGLYRGRTDAWVKGDGPAYFNELGNPQAFVDETGQPVPSLQAIAAMNDGDTRTIGDLAAAARELEVRATRGKTLGIDLDAAREMFTRATPKLHEARAALTKYFRALADLQVIDGLISPELRQKFNSDEMYVAIRRLFNERTGEQAGQLDVKKVQTGAAVPQTAFKMTGSKRDIQNPFEAAIDMTGRVQRAAELNRMAKTFIAYLDALPADIRQHVGQRLSKAPDVAGLDEAAKALKAELADVDTNISLDEARNMLMGLSDESLNVTNGVLRYYDNGVPQAVRLAAPYERMFKSFRPHEMEFVMAGLAPIEKITNIAKIGITANPFFVVYQSIRDMWQFYMNGAYGGIPGISLLRSAGGSVAGAFHIIAKSPEYRKFIQAGGVGDSIASQGLQVTRDGLSLLRQVQTAPARTKIGEVINDAKTLNWTGLKDAYANAVISISDAARVGAYLTERGRGASVLDALYATKKYGANFSNRGDWATIQALNKLTLFLNPSIQGLSATIDAAKQNPVNWFARGMAGITIPSMLLYFAYEDDEQIRELRGTPTGRKFWWMRGSDNELIKIPKPLFEGQLFGTSIEAVMDSYKENDPVALDTWREAMLNDVTLNLTPLIASIPFSLWANKDLNFGGQITPDRNVDPAYLRNQNTTGLSQEVAGLMSNWTDDIDNPGVRRALSPAGIDYIVRNLGGTLSFEALKAVSVVMKYSRTGEMPLRDELPFINSAFPTYPNNNVQSIKEFYMLADKADRAKQSMQYLIDNRLGEDAGKYVVDHLEDVALAPLYADARAELTDLRKAIQDIRQLPVGMIPKGQTRQQMIQDIQERMILIARETNLAARSARARLTAQKTTKDSTNPSDSIMNR